MNIRHCTHDKTLQGTVTSVNQVLLFFTIENVHSVNMGYLHSQRATLALPNIGDEVMVTNTHYRNTCLSYACERSTIKIARCSYSLPEIRKQCLLKRLISEWKLGVADLAEMYSMYVKLQTCYRLTDKLLGEITLNLLKVILECRNCKPTCSDMSCLNKVLPLFHLKSVCDCNFVDIQSVEYKKFPYWSFGVHPSIKTDCLVGYLYVDPKYGTFMLKDTNYKILCVIVNRTKALKQLIDSFVLIMKYYVVTELYQDPTIGNLEYIIVDFDNIKLLQQIENDISKRYFDCSADTVSNLEHYITFYLKSVSATIISMTNNPVRWLQILVKNCDDLSLGKNVLLSVSNNFLKIIPFLTEGKCYKLQYNGTIKNIFSGEFQRSYPDHQQFSLLDENFVLNLEDSLQPAVQVQLMDVLQCKQYITTCPNDLVSFRGKIKTKKFSDPLPSRTNKKTKVLGFGTPGPKTHYIEFAVEGDSVKTLSVYLNNWESILMPFGLIPDIVLCMKNVSHQKGKYCKATPMTSFEILGYEPNIEYTTINLFTGNGDNWGTPFYLSLGNRLPFGVLVWCEIQSVRVRSLKISMSRCRPCCSEKETTLCKCSDTQTSAATCDTMITLLVEDIFGIAKIISRSTELLQVLLNLQPHEWDVWTRAFEGIGTYEFNSENTIRNSRNVLFDKVLTNAINIINSTGIFKLDLCCRKMNSTSRFSNTEPLWYCTRARKNC